MQHLNWNDLRYLLAVKRAGSLSAAARLMGVDGTTVSRRLAALRRALGEDLLHRQPDGSLVLTDHGAKATSHIEAMERETDLLSETFGGGANECIGTVRITSVPLLINRWLAPQVDSLLQQHPKLQIDLIPDSRDFSLTLREADIALRFARPQTGGNDVIARRVGLLPFSVFSAKSVSHLQDINLPWVTYDDSMAHLPQAKWLAQTLKRNGGQPSGLRVHDIETALEAVIAGIGKSLLPTPIAGRIPALRQLDAGCTEVSREVWLLSHRNQHSLRRIAEVTKWIAAIFKRSH
ncbi:LysR substrate-binding domain-containing protein [Anderseniella sp. Alg231-50]|uniref:LysR substrate-binding domain-containing protein n=1 Tax=Anderseniella sp. Alg231-50 TaxID=1922226 RepID=UPI000D55B2D6